ncbi:MAG: flagellin [Sulfitobacter sp.]
MRTTSLGDMAHTFMLQRRSANLRHEMARLTDELSSGQVSDIKSVLSGNHAYLTGIERSFDTLAGYSVANTEARHFGDTMQTVLENIQNSSGQLAADLTLAGSQTTSAVSSGITDTAGQNLQSMIAALNTSVAGRGLFGGTATDRASLNDAQTLLNALSVAVGPQASATDAMNAATAWFDDPAGFTAMIYNGSADTLAPIQLADQVQVSFDIRANDPELREALKHAAMAALAENPTIGLNQSAQRTLYTLTGNGLLAAQDDLVAVRARLGSTQASIEDTTARNSAEKTSLEIARNTLLAADPFETATRLDEVQFQLQSLYSVTVRSGQLSLVNFL